MSILAINPCIFPDADDDIVAGESKSIRFTVEGQGLRPLPMLPAG